MFVGFFTSVVSTFGTFLISIYICWKALNLNPSAGKKAVSAMWCFAWALLDAANFPMIPVLIVRVLFCSLTIAFIWGTMKIKYDAAISAYLLSFGGSYVLYAISFFLVGFPFAPFLGVGSSEDFVIDFNQTIYILFYVLIAALQFTLAYRFFKIRRFKLGFPFLSSKYTVAVTLIIAGIFLAFSSLIINLRERHGTYYFGLPLIGGVVVVGIGIFIWIRRSMKSYQKKKAWERNEELLLKENEKLRSELQHYKEMHESVRSANHRIMHRLSAAEENVVHLIRQAKTYGISDEFSKELAVSLEDVSELSQEYQEMVGTEFQRRLPSINIPSTDALFKLFAERFASNNIDFSLKVRGSIIHMTETVVSKKKLETMIGDHLQDALNAVSAGNGIVRSVLVMLGEVNGCYELSIHDSGIPFEVDTLVRLGTEHITTRSEDGGSGEGFMTTFETMRDFGASLIIHENSPGSTFSKVITIRFDGQSKYIIETYRPGDFPLNSRYTVVSCNN